MKNCSKDAREKARGKHAQDTPINKQNWNLHITGTLVTNQMIIAAIKQTAPILLLQFCSNFQHQIQIQSHTLTKFSWYNIRT